ncbi:MAG TPA: sugar phosphate isomerase/epimerase family protein [Thermoguttaceae bacterium]|nr:sugar phosphate isomerase/epimerase family protein [Thermoguttaceae bacterium]
MIDRTRPLYAAVASAICLCLFLLIPLVRAGEAPGKGHAAPLFALTNCAQCEKYATPDAQARVLKELGYAGIAPSGTSGIPDMLQAVDKHGLKMTALYVGANLDPDKPKYDPKLPEVIRALKGRDTFIWLYILRGKFQPSSSDGDSEAVAIVREIAAMCDESGIRVALYPHTGFYVQRVEDAVRVAEKADRPNVGVTFNLCHWLKVDEPASMKRLMELALPRLFLVTINGADRDGESWDRLIQPLDRGSFDVYGFLKTLKQLGYGGPIGLQCYAVPGDKYENLKRSMDAWRKLSARLAAE